MSDLMKKYKEYKKLVATEWTFLVNKTGEYCRVDGIDDRTKTIMIIPFDKKTAEMLLENLKRYLKSYKERFGGYEGCEKEVGYA